MRDKQYTYEPKIESVNVGFEFILKLLKKQQPFGFIKLNHGVWENLAKLRKSGIGLNELRNAQENLDQYMKINPHFFSRDHGHLIESIDVIKNLPIGGEGIYFAADLEPWPCAREVEGCPFEGYNLCEAIINEVVSESVRAASAAKGLRASLFKNAVITGEIFSLLETVAERNVLAICNDDDREFFESYPFKSIEYVRVSRTEASAARRTIYEKTRKILSLSSGENRSPTVLMYCAGETMGVWLCDKLWRDGYSLQFMDFGGALFGLTENGVNRRNWSRIYSLSIGKSLKKAGGVFSSIGYIYTGDFEGRSDNLVRLAEGYGIPLPAATDEVPRTLPPLPLPFFDEKARDDSRVNNFIEGDGDSENPKDFYDLLDLLEKAVGISVYLPMTKAIIAVPSGLMASQVAKDVLVRSLKEASWIIGPLRPFLQGTKHADNSIVADCDDQSEISLDSLMRINPCTVSGVDYSSIGSAWPLPIYILDWCENNNKSLIINHYYDMPDFRKYNIESPNSIEVIYGHPDNPWSVGDTSFLVVHKDREKIARTFLNANRKRLLALNPTAKDISFRRFELAAQLDRLERFEYYSLLHDKQARRIRAVVEEFVRSTGNIRMSYWARSPKATSIFFADRLITQNVRTRSMSYRKLRTPLPIYDGSPFASSPAKGLHERSLCLSNSPVMRCLTDDEIISDLRLIFG
jgi:hypothetical protein